MNQDQSILDAGRYIIQMMPRSDEEIITRLEKQIQALPAISTLMQEANSPEQILQRLFGNEEVKFHAQLPIVFHCKCSKERLEQAITGLGNDEIQAMIDEHHGAEATCHFCNEIYQL